MVSVMEQLLPSYYASDIEQTVYIATTELDYEAYKRFGDIYCIAEHSDFHCSIEKCRYHIILCSEHIEETLSCMYDLNFYYQSIDDMYTLYKLRFYKYKIASKGEWFEQLERAMEHNIAHPQMEKRPGLAKSRLLRKIYHWHPASDNEHLSKRSAFLQRVQTVRKTKYEYALMKIIDCFLDGYGTVYTDHVNFEIKH